MDRFLKSSAILRIIALVLACTIWIVVNAPNDGGFSVTTNTARFPYPIHVAVGTDMIVTQIDQPTAEVAVNGDTLSVTSLPAQMMGVSVIANAHGLGPGTHVLHLTASNMPDITYSIEPSTVTVVLERKAIVQKAVQVTLEGKPATGYNAGTPVTDTPSVQITGVNAAVQTVASVVADVSVQGASQPITKVVNLRPEDRFGKAVAGVELNPVTVTVTIPILPPQVAVNVVPQIVGAPAAGYAIAGVEINPASIFVTGLPAVTSNLHTWSVPIDVTGFRTTKTVHLKLPMHAGLTKLEPSTVEATVRIEPSASKTFTALNIQMNNVPKDVQVKFTGSQSVDVTVVGPASVIGTLTAAQLRVYIDAGILKPGSTSAQVDVSAPDWIQVAQLSANSVPVQVIQTSSSGHA